MNASQEKPFVGELFFVRAIACLSVVCLHAISLMYLTYNPTPAETRWVQAFQMLFMFATPLFVCISEFLLAYSYPDRIPRGFWKRRIQYILLPFVFMGGLYAFVYKQTWPERLERFMDMVFAAQWHGYFVLIIFQFYVIHTWWIRRGKKWPLRKGLFWAFAINFGYLFIIFLLRMQQVTLDGWMQHHHLIFPAWIFYFAVGYYAGVYFDEFKAFVTKYSKWILTGTAGYAFLVAFIKYAGWIPWTASKRFDILPYTILMLCALYYLATRMKEIPSWVILISHTSYGIYLLHPIVMGKLLKETLLPDGLPFAIFFVVMFTGGVIIPFLVTYILNQLPYGAYLVGKLGKSRKSITNRRTTANAYYRM